MKSLLSFLLLFTHFACKHKPTPFPCQLAGYAYSGGLGNDTAYVSYGGNGGIASVHRGNLDVQYTNGSNLLLREFIRARQRVELDSVTYNSNNQPGSIVQLTYSGNPGAPTFRFYNGLRWAADKLQEVQEFPSLLVPFDTVRYTFTWVGENVHHIVGRDRNGASVDSIAFTYSDLENPLRGRADAPLYNPGLPFLGDDLYVLALYYSRQRATGYTRTGNGSGSTRSVVINGSDGLISELLLSPNNEGVRYLYNSCIPE
jgi:hypothetical protein